TRPTCERRRTTSRRPSSSAGTSPCAALHPSATSSCARLLGGQHSGLRRRRNLAADLEEGVRQGDRRHVLRQLRIDDEYARPALGLARLQGVLVEAEALELVEVRRRLLRRVTWDRLRGH